MTLNALKSTMYGAAGLLLLVGSGCSSTTLFGYIPAVPVERVPPSMLGRPKEEMQEISLSRLARRPLEEYRVAEGDILGVFIQNVLDNRQVRDAYSGLPYEFPEDPSEPPYVGVPVIVQAGGLITLPLNTQLNVEGMTVLEIQDLLRKSYTVDRQIVPEGLDTIVVTLQRKRNHKIFVVRQDTTTPTNVVTHVDKDAQSKVVDLPEGENDLMHALSVTGGLPGLDAKNEVVIIRRNGVDGREWDKIVSQLMSYREPCTCPTPIPDAPNVVRIPIRFFPERVPEFSEEDIVLYTGDIVLIESREREKFYTGGVLGGGEFPIPRDYDLDIMGAIALAGGPVGSTGAVLSQVNSRGGAFAGGGRGGGGPLPPTDAIVIRKLCDGSQIPIRVDLKRVFDDPRQRILIQPEDVVILRYKCVEEIANTALSLVQFNFLFNGFRGGGFN